MPQELTLYIKKLRHRELGNFFKITYLVNDPRGIQTQVWFQNSSSNLPYGVIYQFHLKKKKSGWGKNIYMYFILYNYIIYIVI